MIRSLLIANRGEIAVRVMRTARALGIRTIAVFSDADRDALHVEIADEAVHIGASPASESYLNVEKIIAAAREHGAEAIHPGYGFLSENPEFSEAVQLAGLTFVGPPADAMRRLGDKISSRELATQHNVPITPGALLPEGTAAQAKTKAEEIGFPVLIKAAAGGGGKGMRIVRSADEVEESFDAARREAKSAFGNDAVYLEKYIDNPRHVEFQVFCDGHGNAVHLGERECSVQRRHQKIIEESPSVALTPDLRKRMGEAAIRIIKAAGYVNAGTVEFLLDGDKFYFLEVNARLQVEHPVTEMVTGEDLVAWQLTVASGEKLPKTQEQIRFRGHAIECRVYAEDPTNGFLPSSGTVLRLEEPHSPGLRVDSGIREGFEIPVYYDPILSKVICWADDRTHAIARMRDALKHYVLLGVRAPLGYLQDVLAHPEFVKGNLSTHFIAQHFSEWKEPLPTGEALAALLAAANEQTRATSRAASGNGSAQTATPWQTLGDWRTAGAGA
ncbi:MAG: acetyl-CoA carboxylase biotin carboxylase subunit [Calditrichaeota bacterium]|nr:acetyl-CoA carboxylase biotin carboxylase subunit [Calditrichota bacterium]MCB9391513.1 acetyl-CoA carboxylase biotin carboxylase subunit [Calditrichota bacterium]